MRLWLSRELSGNYCLTLYEPVLAKIGDSEHENFYERPGEPIGIRHLCPSGTKAMFGFELKRLQSIEVEVTGVKI